MFSFIYNNRQLIYSFTKRDIQLKYKSSFLGILWSFLTPLFMLAIYTYFFGFILQSKWDVGSQNQFEFAIFLFCGLCVFNFFSDILNRSPDIIVFNVNYVKKVVFPIEILPITLLGSALFQFMINLILLLVSVWLFYGTVSWTVILFPVIIIPLLLISIGLSWFLSALGVYIRDVSQIIGLAVQALIFLSPVFYPISIIPEKMQIIYKINPLTGVIENARRILIQGQLPNWNQLLVSTGIGIFLAFAGYIWFRKLRGGFADVL